MISGLSNYRGSKRNWYLRQKADGSVYEVYTHSGGDLLLDFTINDTTLTITNYADDPILTCDIRDKLYELQEKQYIEGFAHGTDKTSVYFMAKYKR
jgi:hypothetical protein